MQLAAGRHVRLRSCSKITVCLFPARVFCLGNSLNLNRLFAGGRVQPHPSIEGCRLAQKQWTLFSQHSIVEETLRCDDQVQVSHVRTRAQAQPVHPSLAACSASEAARVPRQ